MGRREFVMLAKTWKGQDVEGWYASEKFDGMRAIWDGLPRDAKRPWARPGVTGVTGLWSRYGNVIHAPEWWTEKLPLGVILDGELDSGSWAKTVSNCRSHNGSWDRVKYRVFDAPRIECFLSSGRVSCGPCKGFNISGESGPLEQRVKGWFFKDVLVSLESMDLDVVPQIKISNDLWDVYHMTLDRGAEGIMLRRPDSVWWPKRSDALLKMKPTDTAVGVVVGHTEGLGKYAGMLGALVVEWEGVEFKLSGMDDALRAEPVGLGKRVLFKHSGFTADGVPREARFLKEV